MSKDSTPPPWEKKKKKGPRMVEVQEGQVLDRETFNDLFSHAKNSGVWYSGNYSKTSQQIREKLYAKGYPKGPIVKDFDGVRESFNLVEEAISFLEDILLLDDRGYAERMAARKLQQKHGRTKARFAMLEKGLAPEVVEEALEAVYSDSLDELLSYIAREWKADFRKYGDAFKVKQRIFRKAVGRGWGFEEINEALELHLEELEEAGEEL